MSDERSAISTATSARQPGLRFEWLLAGTIVLVGAVIVAVWSRDTWFFSDVWDFLAMRKLTDLESMLRPHYGHWQVPAALQTRVLYSLAGMDFWPVHYLPRAIGWAGISVFSWWLMRRRGAQPVVALGALAVITVLAASYYFHAAHIGALIAIACALGAAMVVERRVEPTGKDLLALFLLLLLAVMSAGVGVASLLGLGIGLIVVRRLGRWLIPVTAAGATYGVWFLTFDVANADAAAAARTLAEIPWATVVNLKNVLLAVTGLPDVAGWPLLLAAIVGAAWLAWNRKLTVFDVLVLSCALVYLVLVTRTRPNLERGAVATNVILLLAPVFVPYLRPVKSRTVVIAGLVFAALTMSNAWRLESNLDDRIALINSGRPIIESTAELISRDDSYLSWLRMTDISGSSQLTLGGVARLVDEGWDPGPPAAESDAVVRLRVSMFGNGEGSATIRPITGKLRSDGCMIAKDGAPITVDVSGAASLTVRSGPRTDLRVEWADGASSGRTTMGKVRRAERDLYLYGGRDTARITLTPMDAPTKLILCGIGNPPPG